MQIPKEKVWRGILLCAENASQLFDGACLLAESGLYGQASSLMVLSAEESTKGFGIIRYSIQSENNQIQLKQYFRDHAFKHEYASIYISLTSLMNEFMDEVEEIEANPEIPESAYTKEFLCRMDSRLKNYLDNEIDPFADVKTWQRDADSVKKRGFYIDYNEGDWRSPANVTEDIYKAMRESAAYLLKTLKPVAEIVGSDELREEFFQKLARISSKPE